MLEKANKQKTKNSVNFFIKNNAKTKETCYNKIGKKYEKGGYAKRNSID